MIVVLVLPLWATVVRPSPHQSLLIAVVVLPL